MTSKSPRTVRASARALLVALCVFGGCAKHATTRMVRVNATSACQPQPSDLAKLTPGGDFPTDTTPPTVAVSQVGVPLALDPTTQGLVVDTVSSGPTPTTFWGMTDMPRAGDVDVLVWSTLGACQVTSAAAAVQGESLGLIDSHHALLNAGDDRPFLFNLSTGINARLAADSVPRVPRTLATVTSFGPGKALLAGGVQSSQGVSDVRPDAEVFTLSADGSTGSFTSIVQLMLPRAQAGALVLPDGDTLLVGGLATSTPPVMLNSSMEIVSPNAPQGSPPVAVSLKAARTSPTVLRLTNGEIFVGGGFDGAGLPVPTGEWFDSALTTPLGTTNLAPPSPPPGDAGVTTPTQYLYAPLEGGAVLAVIAGAGGNNVLFLPACDATNPPCLVTPEPGVAIASTVSLGTNAVLLPAANGSPVLWTGTAWLRWDPWGATFDPIATPGDGGATAPGPSGLSSLAADPGLAIWVAGDGFFYGLRYDTRGPFVNDDLIGTKNTAPDHVSNAVAGTGPVARWELGGNPGLSVSNGAKVFLTDATFEDFSVTATMIDGWAGIIVRDEMGCEYDVGTTGSTTAPSCPPFSCPFPDFVGVAGAMGAAGVAVQRSGTTVKYSINAPDGPFTPCADAAPFSPGERLSVGIYGPGAERVETLTITRGP